VRVRLVGVSLGVSEDRDHNRVCLRLLGYPDGSAGEFTGKSGRGMLERGC
jgi:hypothetical protein